MKVVKNMIVFILGATAGSIGTYVVLKNKFDKETQNIRDFYKDKTDIVDDDKREKYNIPKDEEIWDGADIRPTKESIKEYKEISREPVDYTKCSDIAKEYNKPRIIDPAEFGTLENFDEPVSLYWNPNTRILRNPVSDHVLSESERIDLIGEEALNHFGEFEDDSVYVRNPRLKMDIEILLE